MRFISSVRHWYAINVNFHQIYQFIVQLLSSWNEFNTWERTEGGCVLFVAPDLSNLSSYCCKILLFLLTWWNKYYFTWRRSLLQREFYMFIVVYNKNSWEICLPEKKRFSYLLLLVLRSREMSRTHGVKHTRFVQSKGGKGFSSEYSTRLFS